MVFHSLLLNHVTDSFKCNLSNLYRMGRGSDGLSRRAVTTRIGTEGTVEWGATETQALNAVIRDRLHSFGGYRQLP